MEEATSATAPAPAAAPTPAAAPAPASTPAPASATAPAPESSGGGFASSIKEAVSTMNWTEVVFGILGSAALFYTIYYYKYNLTMNKTFKAEMQNKIDDLTIKLSDLQSASQRDVVPANTPQQGFDGFF
jgi:hypothetical protein